MVFIVNNIGIVEVALSKLNKLCGVPGMSVLRKVQMSPGGALEFCSHFSSFQFLAKV